MSLAKIMRAKLMILVALWLSVSNSNRAQKQEVYGDGNSAPNACLNCSICNYPCHPQPPSPPPPPPEYPSYGPPLAPSELSNCPPTPFRCCQYAPPTPYTYLPYGNYSASLPIALHIKPSCTISSATFLLFLFEYVF